MARTASSFRLLVFDWDGTLMDSIGSIVACILHSLRELDLEEPPEEALRGTIGMGLSDLLVELYPDLARWEIERLIERFRHHWITDYRRRPVLIEGARRALETLEDHYFLAVATGKSRAGLDRDLEMSGLGGYFSATRTIDEAMSKPHPQMLLELSDEFGVASSETLMVGDTTFDLEMARNAGSPAVAVLTGAQQREELMDCAPLECLPSVGELPAWLAGARPGRLSEER